MTTVSGELQSHVLEDVERAEGVDLEVAARVLQRGEERDLPGEVGDRVEGRLVGRKALELAPVADVDAVDAEAEAVAGRRR